MVNKLQGAIPPMITPFDSRGNLDEKALREVVNFLIDKVQGLFICGSYGCGPLMRPDQRKRCAEIVVEVAKGKVPVIVQVGTTDTETAVMLATHAQDIGADIVASYPPFYFHHTDGNVLGYFEGLVKATSIPVYVYNNPKFTGYSVTPKFARQLAEIGVQGLKDSSFDIMILSDYVRMCGTYLDIVLGTEAMYLPASALGINAFIPGLGNACPELMQDLWQECNGSDRARAIEVHQRVTRLRTQLQELGPSTVVVQELLKLRRINAGLPRPPLMPLSQENREKMIAVAKENGVC